MFELHPRLAQDSLEIGRFPLGLLLLSKDANYPWLILVPQREDVSEIHHLSEGDQQQLLKESCILAEVMVDLFDADKLNIAALGNMVPQLHIHHIARYTSDPAWPNPIWGAVPAKPYDENPLNRRVSAIRNALVGESFEITD
ncbi:MAG: HIT domain-containing protein [bacterium]